ncbi:hypothetical protein E2C01_037143 [Portunus trituberculatus]|uniref:Uncharacterized protein n=1 Tax=Portunus trituberculatus TaxID=210409 RepID=A0A5B7FGA1_PORTR|nr:hypothetical protein [Portunus trituberculatus]
MVDNGPESSVTKMTGQEFLSVLSTNSITAAPPRNGSFFTSGKEYTILVLRSPVKLELSHLLIFATVSCISQSYALFRVQK